MRNKCEIKHTICYMGEKIKNIAWFLWYSTGAIAASSVFFTSCQDATEALYNLLENYRCEDESENDSEE